MIFAQVLTALFVHSIVVGAYRAYRARQLAKGFAAAFAKAFTTLAPTSPEEPERPN